MMKISKVSSFILGLYTISAIWWVVLLLLGDKNSSINLAFVFAYGFIPLFGGLFGLQNAKKWGFFKSSMGKALLFLSLGLITWSIGEMIWTLYYNILLKIEIPYPSFADASFILSWPLWIIGIFFLSKATGAKFGLRKLQGRMQLLFIPIIISVLSYYLLVIVARGGSIEFSGGITKIFFDLAYPLFDVIIITIVLLVISLSYGFLGGRFKWSINILFMSFIVNYFADFTFSYTTTISTYFNGHFADFLFATAMFLLSFSINNFDIKLVESE